MRTSSRLGSIFSLWAVARTFAVSAAAPSPASLSSSLTFLYQNDLDWTTATQHAGAILLQPRANQDARASCSSLGETLLPVAGSHFFSDITALLSYLAYEGAYPKSQEYWIASSKQLVCQTIDGNAKVSDTPCTKILPALCSQSAPYAPAGAQVNNPTWDITLLAQDLTFTGYRDHLSFRFLGIPYANMLERFTYSTVYSGHQKVFNATSYGSQCMQAGGGGSEDCLFLNIFTPFIPRRATDKGLKPVIFHIHGGGFTGGTGNDATFDGGNIASRNDVVVVDINYRLSTLGFLALSDGHTNGNFGISDMVTALEWVQKYISAFGGDPNRITIAGQSAGAASVRVLLGSPKAIGKFSAAIPMSNLAGLDYATQFSLYPTISVAVANTASPIIALTGCNNTSNAAILACLRAYDAQKLVTLSTTASYVVIDGTYVTSKQLPLDGSGPIAHVPVMMGFMRDDGAAFIGYPQNNNLTQFLGSVLYGSPTPSAVVASNLFPEPVDGNSTLNVFNVTARVTTDVMFRCLDQAGAVSAVKYSVFPKLWFYQFDRSYQTPGWDPNAPVCDAPKDATHPNGDPSKPYFHCHSGELYYVWGTLGQFSLPFRDANDLPFNQFTQDVWASFVRTHDPNPSTAYLEARNYQSTISQIKRAGPWNPVTETSDVLRLMDYPASSGEFQDKQQCQFLGFPFTYFG